MLMSQYSSSENFLKLFNPSNQFQVLQNEVRAYTGTAPTLTRLKLGFGQHICETWIMAQIQDLNNFCGVKDKVNQLQLIELSKLILTEHFYLKVTEVMLFFAQFKLGKYGKFYGVIDPIVITTALNTFLIERSKVVNAIMLEEKERIEEQKQIEREKIAVDRATYEEIKWLFNM